MNRVLWIVVISALAAPLVSIGQTTVFQDTFTNGSTINPASAVTPTADKTAYEIASGKVATATGITSGALNLAIASTSSGFVEAQAQFTSTPITLSSPGQYIELYVTFTDPTNFFNGNAANNNGITIGLYNSGGVALTDGTNLWNANMASTSNSEENGNAQNWQGYAGDVQYSGSTGEVSTIDGRAAQTGTDNINQGLGDESGSGVLSTIGISSSSTALFSPILTAGDVYTIALQITDESSTTDEFTESLLTGSGTGGSVIFSLGGLNTNGSLLTGTFDSLEVGYRSTQIPNAAQSVPITSITVQTGVSVVPEPSSYGLLVLAMFGAAVVRRRFRMHG